MTEYESTIYAALIATVGALLGGLIGSFGTYFIQKNTIKNETSEHAKRTLINHEIHALQQFSALVDFLEANAGHLNNKYQFANQFLEIAHECSRNISYLPHELREESREIIKTIFQGMGKGSVNLEEEKLLNLRAIILNCIDALKKKTF